MFRSWKTTAAAIAAAAAAWATAIAHQRRHAGADPVARPAGAVEMIAVLCAARNSVYHGMEGVEVYDELRDARTFPGDLSIVAHPPCRAWSAFCSHQAKPAPGEKELGLWCCQMLRQCGGVLEQPAHSRLFEAAGFPDERVFVMECRQSWWGDVRSKKTWLAIAGVSIEALPPIPFRLINGGCRQQWNKLSKTKRSATPPAMAQWLVVVASIASPA